MEPTSVLEKYLFDTLYEKINYYRCTFHIYFSETFVIITSLILFVTRHIFVIERYLTNRTFLSNEL